MLWNAYLNQYKAPESLVNELCFVDHKSHKTNIIAAIARNDPHHLKLLLKTGIGIDYVDKEEYTLLHQAVRMREDNQPEVLDCLLSFDNVPLNNRNYIGETALILAIKRSKEDFAVRLCARGADVNLPDHYRFSPLAQACELNLTQIGKVLIEKGAPMHVPDNESRSPLIIACKEGHVNVIYMLLYYGADFWVPSGPFTTFDLAKDAVRDILSDYFYDDLKGPIFLGTLTALMVSNSDLFPKLCDKISDVEYCSNENFECWSIFESKYFDMFIERFPHVTKVLFLRTNIFKEISDEISSRIIENLLVICGSNLIFYAVEGVNRSRRHYQLGDFIIDLQRDDMLDQTSTQIISCFVHSGLRIDSFDLDLVYTSFGFCQLFKDMLEMDFRKADRLLHAPYFDPPHIMPSLIYDVTLTIDKFLNKYENYDLNTLYLVLGHFAKPNFKEFCLNVPKWTSNIREPRKLLSKRAKGLLVSQAERLPTVPSLTELSRNCARQYIIKLFKIKNYHQLREILDKLSVGTVYKKILTYEKKIYHV